MRHGPVTGMVESWDDVDGCGVLRAPDGTRVWCHVSQVDRPGYRTLAAGAPVVFDYETPGQDGYPARVRTRARPLDRPPGAGEPPEGRSPRQPGSV